MSVESKPNWIETPSHLGGGFTALTAPNSFVAIMPAGPEWTARLQLPMGGHKVLIITDFIDTQDVMDKSWAWALSVLGVTSKNIDVFKTSKDDEGKS